MWVLALYYKFSTECAGKKFEYRSIFDEYMDKNLVLTFLAYTMVYEIRKTVNEILFDNVYS